jgi:deoxyribodipyrimidine photo-lyase
MTSALPLTRAAALMAWEEFLPQVASYAWRRNHVEVGHRHVSRLSAALRYRLVTEDEVISDTQGNYDFKAAEKWLQEVCWRRYWKGWLEKRPQVWSEWQQRVTELRATLPQRILDHAEAVAAGRSGVACMDLIARELIETGYLHNHARMWWASFWIHAEGLPWELGADFFFRHLLDADPASNTLSWRWVAGLQTPGKTYLVRLSNLEKYAAKALLSDRTGSERIADGAVKPASQGAFSRPEQHLLTAYPTELNATDGRAGLWLHPDDLSPETGPLADFTPVAVAGFNSQKSDHSKSTLSEKRLAALATVMGDGLVRAAAHYRCPAELLVGEDLAGWACSQQLEEVVAFAPTVGPIHDLLPRLSAELQAKGIKLTLIRRPSDGLAFSLAGAGFFPFWEKMSKHLQQPRP